MALAVVGRMAHMTCVPLFMMLTGWLCIDRRWSPGYYRKLLPTLLVYGLAGCLRMLFSAVWMGIGITPLSAVHRLLDFNAAPYGWYIEMYIGLFLPSPFLNAAWKGLTGGRRALAGVLTYREWNDYQSLLVVGETVCLFSLLARCRGTGIPASVRWCVGKRSQLPLSSYSKRHKQLHLQLWGIRLYYLAGRREGWSCLQESIGQIQPSCLPKDSR